MNKRETSIQNPELYELFYDDKGDWFNPNTEEVKDPSSAQNIINFWNKIKTEKVDKNDFDFSEMVVPSYEGDLTTQIKQTLDGIDTNDTINFSKARFRGKFRLEKILFNSYVTFVESTFESDFYILKCTFKSSVQFKNVTFKKKIWIGGNEFESNTSFEGSKFIEGFDLDSVNFNNQTDFGLVVSSTIINLRKENSNLYSQIDAIKDKKLSEHYEKQYDSANNSKELNVWKWSAALFLVLTIVLGLILFLVVEEHTIESLVVRIAIVAPLFVAAIFCANQYTRQKNIAEDYAFKKVLSNSILSFSEHLRSDNPDGYSEYTKILLKRLHQPPQHRSQKSNVRRRDMLKIIQDTLSTVKKNKLDT